MFEAPLTYIPKSRAEAVAIGSKFYHPGKNCRQGHYSVFYTKAQRCKVCARIRVCAARHKNHSYAQRQRDACKRYYRKKYHGDDEYREKINAQNRSWREGRKEWFNEYAKEWRRNKFAAGDESVIAREAWRNILGRSIRAGYKKDHSTADILGYRPTDLRDRISSMFLEGMSWANHGEWHIDHIRPISSFPPDSPPCEVHALSNLQPLWAKDNLAKSDKWK